MGLGVFKFLRKAAVKSIAQVAQEDKWRKAGQLARRVKDKIPQEARRVFRAGEPLNLNSYDPHVGISVSRKRKYARNWQHFNGGDFNKYAIKPGAKILKHKDIPRELLTVEKIPVSGGRTIKSIMPRDTSMKELISYAKSKGYDAIDLSIIYPETHEYRVINPNVLLGEWII